MSFEIIVCLPQEILSGYQVNSGVDRDVFIDQDSLSRLGNWKHFMCIRVVFGASKGKIRDGGSFSLTSLERPQPIFIMTSGTH